MRNGPGSGWTQRPTARKPIVTPDERQAFARAFLLTAATLVVAYLATMTTVAARVLG